MKNLLTKTLFTLLLLSASIPFGVQAANLGNAVTMGQEIAKAAAAGVAQEGRKVIRKSILAEVVVLAAVVPSVVAVVAVTVRTGNVQKGLKAGVFVVEEMNKVMGKAMIAAAAVVLTAKIMTLF